MTLRIVSRPTALLPGFPIEVEGGRKIYVHEDGTCSIADGGGWLPGSYEDEAAALLALERAGTTWEQAAALEAFCEGINVDERRTVTTDDLRRM